VSIAIAIPIYYIRKKTAMTLIVLSFALPGYIIDWSYNSFYYYLSAQSAEGVVEGAEEHL